MGRREKMISAREGYPMKMVMVCLVGFLGTAWGEAERPAALTLEGLLEPLEIAEIRIHPKAFTGDFFVKTAVAPLARVKAGQTILECEARKGADQLAQVERELASARAAYRQAKEDQGFQAQADSLAWQKADREKRWSQVKHSYFKAIERSLATAESEIGLKEMEDNIENQKEELAQLEAMYKSEELTNATAEIVVRRAKRGLDRTQTKYAQRVQRHEKLINQDLAFQSDQLAAEAAQRAWDLEHVERMAPLKQAVKNTELMKLSAEVVRQEDRLKEFRQDLEGMTVASLMDGVVYYGWYERGKWEGQDAARALKTRDKVTPGVPLLTVVGRKGMKVRAAIPEMEYGRIKKGALVTVQPVAFSDFSVSGRVEEMMPVFTVRQDGSRWAEAVIALEHQEDRLAPGMKVYLLLRP